MADPSRAPVVGELVTVEPGVRLFCRRLGTGENAVVIPHATYLMDQFSRIAMGRTAIFVDWRNRGYSEALTNPRLVGRGIFHDVSDLERVRRHFGCERISLVTHSYSAISAILFAIGNPERVERLVLIGAPGPAADKVYPPELSCHDEVAAKFRQSYAKLQSLRDSMEPERYCRQAWKLMRMLYVGKPADADRLGWETCGIPNERAFMHHWITNLYPSLRALQFSEEMLGGIRAPVLLIHGRKDRSAPYGAACEWAARLPNARLITVEEAAHVPWIEAPELVFGSIDTFLGGHWPDAAQLVDNFGQGGSVTT